MTFFLWHTAIVLTTMTPCRRELAEGESLDVFWKSCTKFSYTMLSVQCFGKGTLQHNVKGFCLWHCWHGTFPLILWTPGWSTKALLWCGLPQIVVTGQSLKRRERKKLWMYKDTPPQTSESFYCSWWRDKQSVQRFVRRKNKTNLGGMTSLSKERSVTSQAVMRRFQFASSLNLWCLLQPLLVGVEGRFRWGAVGRITDRDKKKKKKPGLSGTEDFK